MKPIIGLDVSPKRIAWVELLRGRVWSFGCLFRDKGQSDAEFCMRARNEIIGKPPRDLSKYHVVAERNLCPKWGAWHLKLSFARTEETVGHLTAALGCEVERLQASGSHEMRAEKMYSQHPDLMDRLDSTDLPIPQYQDVIDALYIAQRWVKKLQK